MAKKTTRSAAGGGTLRKRGDGRWEARYTVGVDPATGKQIQKSIYGKTQKEVREQLRKVTSEIDEGSYFEPSNMALGDWLDIWMKDYLKDVKPRTVNSYCSTVRNRIKPALGRIRLKALTPVHIQMFTNELYEGEDGDGGLSAKTVHDVHNFVNGTITISKQLQRTRNSKDTYSLITPKNNKSRTLTPARDILVRLLKMQT